MEDRIDKDSLAADTTGDIAAEGTLDEILDQAGLEDEEPAATETDRKEQELKEAEERFLRLMADFDNYRKRVQREKEEWFKYASMTLIEKLLPVIDNMERALDNLSQQGEEVQNFFAGVEMIYRQLLDVLQQAGLEAIEDLGTEFNPELHEAMMQVKAEEGQDDNQVVEVLRKGYCFKDRVLRPSMVKVAKK